MSGNDERKPIDSNVNYNSFRLKYTRGGSRVPCRGGANIQYANKLYTPTYDFAKFSEKLHEIEKILGRRGRVPGPPPWGPPLYIMGVPAPWGGGGGVCSRGVSALGGVCSRGVSARGRGVSAPRGVPAPRGIPACTEPAPPPHGGS